MNDKIYAYPAIFTIFADKMTVYFPDFNSYYREIQPTTLDEAFDCAADYLSVLLNEYFTLGKALPHATKLEDLPLKDNEKGAWIQLAEQ